MPLLGIIFIILSSILTGTLITTIFRERNSAFVVKFATGFLSLFVFLMLTVLVALKLDWDLGRMSLAYLVIVIAASLVSLPAFLKLDFKNIKIKPGKPFGYIILAAIVGIVSFAVLSQSYINDDILEIAYTSVSTNTIYEYSSLTGNKMINGLPIYNKIYVMPMLVSFLYKVFGITPMAATLVILPVIMYITNICLVSRIADEVNVSSKNVFMVAYIVLLVSGTYISVLGIPATAGYALLRQGYSGYAVIYGIIIPLTVLALLKKKYHLLVIYLPSMLPLFRIDRVVFALLDFRNSYHMINTAGRELGIYILAVLAAWIMYMIYSDRTPAGLFVAPMVLASCMADKFISKAEERKVKIILSISFLLIALLCVNFTPYGEAVTNYRFFTEKREVEECVKEIALMKENPVIFADSEFMTNARRNDYMVRTLYGRDYNSLYMAGLNYETISPDIYDYYRFAENKVYGFNYLVTDKSDDEILLAAREEGASVIVFPVSSDTEKEADLYLNAGFEYRGIIGKYSIYSLK